MTQAYNLSQLANHVNSSGQIDASTGLYNGVPSAAKLLSTNFAIEQIGTELIFKYDGIAIAKLDSSGNFTTLTDITAYGTP